MICCHRIQYFVLHQSEFTVLGLWFIKQGKLTSFVLNPRNLLLLPVFEVLLVELIGDWKHEFESRSSQIRCMRYERYVNIKVERSAVSYRMYGPILSNWRRSPIMLVVIRIIEVVCFGSYVGLRSVP